MNELKKERNRRKWLLNMRYITTGIALKVEKTF